MRPLSSWVIYTTADFDWLTFVVLPMRWNSFVMRYMSTFGIIYVPIPRWRCPALIKDYWRRLWRVSLLYQRSARVVRAAKTQGIRSMAAVDIAIAERGENKPLFSVMRRRPRPACFFEHNVTVSGVVGVPQFSSARRESKEALTHSHFPRLPPLRVRRVRRQQWLPLSSMRCSITSGRPGWASFF